MKLLEKDVEFSEDQRDEMMRVFLRTLTDKYERCREVSCDICLTIFRKIPREEVQKCLPFLFQVFSRSLSLEEEYEPSEEVRVKMMELLTLLFEMFTTELQGNMYIPQLSLTPHSSCPVYVEDVVEMVVSVLEDKCPQVKRLSASLVVRLAQHHKKVLRLKGSVLAAPLARNVSHRQSPVRAVTVAAIGSLVLTTDGAVFEILASHAAQRVFDQSPQVRLKLVEVLGEWLVAMPDR